MSMTPYYFVELKWVIWGFKASSLWIWVGFWAEN